MPTYESSGSLTTIEKSYPSAQTPDLSGLVYTLNGQSVSVDVVGSPGQAGEEVVTQSLGGASSYDLTWSNAHSDFEVVFNLSTADDQASPQVDDLTLTGQPNAPSISVSEVTDTPDIALSWPAVSTADEYRVYRAESPGSVLGDYTLLDTTTTTGYTDTTVALGTRYYYRVTAYNTSTGESEASNEVRVEANADDYTEQVTWDTQREWDYGTYTNTTDTGSGGVSLAEDPQDTFDYSIDVEDSVDGLIEIRDADTNTVLFSDSVSPGPGTATGSYTVDTFQHPSLEFYVEVTDNNANGTGSASISEQGGSTLAFESSGVTNTGTFTDTATATYGYYSSGSYQTDVWDYTNTTTATRVIATATLTEPSQSITITPTTESGTTGDSVTLSDGQTTGLVEVPPSDRYYLDVTLERGTTGNETPVLEVATLEAHTDTDGGAVVDTRNMEVDLSWNAVSVCDGYQVLYSENTPVTASDTVGFENADSAATSGTVTGLKQGETYYFNVRAKYSGE